MFVTRLFLSRMSELADPTCRAKVNGSKMSMNSPESDLTPLVKTTYLSAEFSRGGRTEDIKIYDASCG